MPADTASSAPTLPRRPRRRATRVCSSARELAELRAGEAVKHPRPQARSHPAGPGPADQQQTADDRGSDFLCTVVVRDVGVRHRNAEDLRHANRGLRFVATLDLGRGAGRLNGGERLQDHVRVRCPLRDGPGIAGRQGDDLAL